MIWSFGLNTQLPHNSVTSSLFLTDTYHGFIIVEIIRSLHVYRVLAHQRWHRMWWYRSANEQSRTCWNDLHALLIVVPATKCIDVRAENHSKKLISGTRRKQLVAYCATWHTPRMNNVTNTIAMVPQFQVLHFQRPHYICWSLAFCHKFWYKKSELTQSTYGLTQFTFISGHCLFSPRKRGSMFLPALVCVYSMSVCLCVWLSVTTITKKIVDGFVPNCMGRFLGGNGRPSSCFVTIGRGMWK